MDGAFAAFDPISQDDQQAPLGDDADPSTERSEAHVAKLHPQARDRAPYLIKRINHLR
jgi:hypothetical protein